MTVNNSKYYAIHIADNLFVLLFSFTDMYKNVWIRILFSNLKTVFRNI